MATILRHGRDLGEDFQKEEKGCQQVHGES